MSKRYKHLTLSIFTNILTSVETGVRVHRIVSKMSEVETFQDEEKKWNFL